LNSWKNNNGFTLLELIVVISLLGAMLTSLQLVLGQAMTAHKNTREKLEHVSQARFAMERITLLITETGFIETPAEGDSGDLLVIEERIMDSYDNSSHSFVQNGDGILDADNDSSGVVNDDASDDPVDKIFISLDKTDADNWRLIEVLPDYSTANFNDTMTQRILCENVILFTITRGSSNKKGLIKINLDQGGDTHTVSLKTRAIAGKLLVL